MMKTISCVIVDDEPLAVTLIENYVRRIPFLELIGSFTDSLTASAQISVLKPDLIFLDIQMPDINGLEMARSIAPPAKIIFTTAFRDYAIDSYDVAAIDYLLKPIRFDKFLRAVNKAREWFEPSDRRPSESDTGISDACREEIFLRKEGGFQRVALDRILFIEGMKDYVRIFMEGERSPLVTHSTMKSIADSLPPDRFMRVNRSYIVALRRIRSVDRNMCIYIGDTMIKVTDGYRDQFESFINDNLLGK